MRGIVRKTASRVLEQLEGWRQAMTFRDHHYFSYLTPGEKRSVLASYGSRAETFIETGTYRGETALAMSTYYRTVISIELDEELYRSARERMAHVENVRVLGGDSAHLLPEVLYALDGPAVFWLDGHYSGPRTGRAVRDTPIVAEVLAIMAHDPRAHTVLIDDARLFTGRRGYPTIGQLAELAHRHSSYSLTIRDDIIRLQHDPEWT